MTGQRIATTRNADLQPLSGQAGPDSWGALHALLSRELSEAHAALLAEPVPNSAQGTIDWYAAGNGPSRRAIDLPDAERSALQARLAELSAGIEALAQTLSARRTDSDRILSVAVREALRTPGPEFAYAVGDQPVLVAWSHGKTGARAGDAVLTGQSWGPTAPLSPTPIPLAAATAASISPPSSAPPAILPPPASPYRALLVRRPSWSTLTWSALGAIVLLAAGGAGIVLRDPFHWLEIAIPQCRLDPGQLPLERELQDAAAHGSMLRAELARLTADAGQRRLMCPPVAVATPTLPLPPSADARRAERQGGRTGKLQVILAWDDRNDLDLQIVCPNDGTINYIRRRACGGRLDVDANGDVNHLTSTPVENVFFEDPAPGGYQIVVDAYGMRERPTTPFRVTVHRDGQPDEVFEGVAQNGQRNSRITTLTVAPQ